MKGKDKKALHAKTIEELNTLLRERKAALVKTRMELSMNKVKNVHAAKVLREEIAIIETIKKVRQPFGSEPQGRGLEEEVRSA